MKVFNCIVVYDVFAVAETEAEAMIAVRAAIQDPDPETRLTPSEHTTLGVTNERQIREAWVDQKPFVGADVSDQDFETLKGKTTIEIFKMLFEKPPANS